MKACLVLAGLLLAVGFILPPQHPFTSSIDVNLDHEESPENSATQFSCLQYLWPGLSDSLELLRYELNPATFGADDYYRLKDDILSRDASETAPFNPFHRKADEPDQSIYEILVTSPDSTIFAKMVSQFDEIVDYLNSTSSDHTLYLPPDKAFGKFDRWPMPPKSCLKKFIEYHISPHSYSLKDLFSSLTVPTLLENKELGSYHQRIAVKLRVLGLSLNFMTRIHKPNNFATNGVVHILDNILIPPFRSSDTLNFLSSELGTLEFGLLKTGLYIKINDSSTHTGATLFMPTNQAFQKLGFKNTAFLFSRPGEKYLKALLKYHVVFNHTLYTDTYYKPSEGDESTKVDKAAFHIDLPTLLPGHHLSIDIAGFSRFENIKINGYTNVAVADIVMKDGVLHLINDVLIPPQKLALSDGFNNLPRETSLSLEGLRERLEPFVEEE
ncbi:hypothetical protein FQN57_000794 [Myotisia sp. PD_48]|nr:hypothetical protein FQN57_000794 [Myotisia sp. PD_48]